MKNRKVVIIGCGSVGTTFLYSALNQSLFDEYVLIDISENLVKGNVWDFEDANTIVPLAANSIRLGNYDECNNADIVVIAADASQPGNVKSRLQLVEGNAKIMVEIATKVRDSGFEGITVIASNPVDILGAIYAKITGFEPNKVIPSGTILDSCRLQYEIAKRTKVSPASVEAFVIGEHGDSSVSAFSQVMIGPMPLAKYKKLSDSQKKAIHKEIIQKAYKIVNAKKATFYGIGACLARICKAVIRNENVVLPVAIKKDLNSDIYIGWPALIGKEGWHNPLKLHLLSEEKKAFMKSYNLLKKFFNMVWSELGINE